MKSFSSLVATAIIILDKHTASGRSDCTHHDQCTMDRYCAGATLDDTRCLLCSNCGRTEAYTAPVNGTECPLKCSCRSHDDCGKASFCSLYEYKSEEFQFCQSCAFCSANHTPYGLDDCLTACAEECQSSREDCPDGYVCSTNGGPRRRECYRCTDSCVDDWLINSNEESCATLCPAQYQCGSHDDCQRRNLTETETADIAQWAGTSDTPRAWDQWCSLDHTCRLCHSGCWHAAFLLGTIVSGGNAAIPQYYNDAPRHLRYNIPMNMSCPDVCCDANEWPHEHWDNENWVIAPCNKTVILGAGWITAFNVTPGETPAHFQSRSKHCETQTRVSPKSLGSSQLPMTLISCPGFRARACKSTRTHRVFAVWVADPISGVAVEWYRPDVFQYPAHVDTTGPADSCRLTVQDIVTVWIGFISVIVVVLVAVVACGYAVLRCAFRRSGGVPASGGAP